MTNSPFLPGLPQLIAATCKRHPIALAYLFGSHARGTADDESDIDIGILAEANLSKAERSDLKLRLIRELSDALSVPMEQVDVVILQDVPALLQFNIIRNGKVVFGKKQSADYILAVERAYEDESPYLDREAEVTIQRILAHRA